MRKHSVIPPNAKAKNCVMNLERDIILLFAKELTSILGVPVE
jgi:hypothetical protein